MISDRRGYMYLSEDERAYMRTHIPLLPVLADSLHPADPFAALLPPEEVLGSVEEADLPDPRSTQLAAQRLATRPRPV